MAFINFSYIRQYIYSSGTSVSDAGGSETVSMLEDGAAGDTFFSTADSAMSDGMFLAGTGDYRGSFEIAGETFYMVQEGFSANYYVYGPTGTSATAWPAAIDLGTLDTTPAQVMCFSAGTMIATPQGEVTVESLCVGDPAVTADGRTVVVRFNFRQDVNHAAPLLHRLEPVCIRAEALGDGLPHSDLTVTSDHGIIVDGLVINAGALVNGTTIGWVPLVELPTQVTYYHIETEDHDVILANGAPAETFIDYAGRQAFDNYREYVDLYGAERIIPEMNRPRISSQRLVPDAIKARLGIVDDGFALDDLEDWARTA